MIFCKTLGRVLMGFLMLSNNEQTQAIREGASEGQHSMEGLVAFGDI